MRLATHMERERTMGHPMALSGLFIQHGAVQLGVANRMLQLLILGVFLLPNSSTAQTVQSGYHVSEVKFGRSVSRPALTYVRLGNQVIAAAIVGCGGHSPTKASNGEAMPALSAGRCVQIRKISDGSLIRSFYTGNGLAGDAVMS